MLEPFPLVSITSPEGRDVPNPSSPTRGFSKLRSLTHNRLQGSGSSSGSPRTLPRQFFHRSASDTERRPKLEAPDRRRSASRPDQHRGDTSPTFGSSTLIPNFSRVSQRSKSLTEQSLSAATEDMARHRASRLNTGTGASRSTRERANGVARTDSAPQASSEPTTPTADNPEGAETKTPLPAIRFFPHQEMRNGRQSLPFTPIARTLPSESSVIRVGRYSEREGIPSSNPTTPSDAPVGFKSKVVSRKHCEFSFANGQWQVRDVSSSSGTFLNHIRLSQPNMVSKYFPVKDGDIVQLGIDFRGGEEMIFRCVKIRIECNRSWQKRPNNFNMTRHAQLQSMGKTEATTQDNSGECSICLGSVLPCQSLFVAACAHVWHYKCIRPMLEGRNSTYPHFQCPNCRAWTDLAAEVDITEEDLDDWMENSGDAQENDQSPDDAQHDLNYIDNVGDETAHIGPSLRRGNALDADLAGMGTEVNEQDASTAQGLSSSGLLARRQATHSASSEIPPMNSIDIPNAHLTHTTTNDTVIGLATPDTADLIAGEGPLTPRNNAGPFVFDGSGSRSSSRRLVSSASGSSQ